MPVTPEFASVPDMLRAWRPAEPVYCIYPDVYLENTRRFVAGFPGRVLYAVKVNDDPRVLKLLHAGGVSHFDCASVPEIRLVNETCPGATAYLMIPVWLRSAAAEAWTEYGVRHFVIDHAAGLAALRSEVPVDRCVVFVRMAVHHDAAMMDLSVKFGAQPDEVPALLQALAAPGVSAVVEVLQRKDQRLYVSDGSYGIFWELRFKGHDRYPVTVFRDARPHSGEQSAFRLFGPTCDAHDVLPGEVELPADVRAGDYLEFGHIGAYSLTGRTRFNGHYSETIITISGAVKTPSP